MRVGFSLVAIALSCLVGAQGVKVGDPAPNLAAPSWVQGKGPSKFEAGKVYVVQFWATWCGSSRAAIPHINELAEKFSGKGVEFLSITDDSAEKVEAFLSKQEIKGSVSCDPSGKDFTTYGVQVIPHTILVDKQGRIAASARPSDVTAYALEKLLAGDSINLPVKSNKRADLEWDNELQGVQTGTADSIGHAILQRTESVSGSFRIPLNSGRITGDGVSALTLMMVAYGGSFESMESKLSKPDMGPYRVSVKAPDGKDETARAMLRELLHRHFSFKAEWIEGERELPVLRYDASVKTEMFRPSSAAKADGGATSGTIKFTGVPFASIAKVLGMFGYGKVLVDETGLTGKFDFDFAWNVADAGSFERGLAAMGFKVTKEKRPTRVLVLEDA
jgi:uncharacterized protein (TIGR03435 family)